MKTSWLKRIVLLLTIATTSLIAQAQIVVTPGLTAQQLAEVFAGSNLTVSNATLTGSPSAAASFTSSSGFEFSSGLLLCTGLATSTPGPNNDPNTGDNLGQAGSLLLETLGGAASRDAIILEFDFVVQSSSVQFNYIFASEEYPEFAPPNQPEFTDVFAFYISGPGIVGEENIALVPGTTLPVNIQNINAVTNQQYYVDNTGGQEIQFDGYTTNLTASKSGLTICQTYHLKLMISDIRTSVRNSAVFFKENSFVQESTLNVSSQTIQADNTAREGCVRGSFTFKIPAPETSDKVISYTVGGTAVNGVDYQYIDNSIIIPAGDTMATVYIYPFSDGVPEGQETVVLDFNSGGCSGSGSTSMFIDDAEPINFSLDSKNLDCFEDNSGEIMVSATGGFPPYSFNYTNELGVAATATSSPITGLAAGEYTVRVSDAYGCKATALVVGGVFNAGTTFLPDGTGVTYEAPLTITGFGAGDVISNVNQIQQVCLTLEHSYVGDLTIDLVSPSGQTVSLKGFGGNSADLGEPVATGAFDDGLSNDPTPGVGYEYCFNANPTFGTLNGESSANFRTAYTDLVGNVYDDFYLPAGSYTPDGNFNGLIGSSMNGDWKIRVTDNAALDNGYIFNWYISLVGDLPDSVVQIEQPLAIGLTGVSTNAICGNADGAINTTIVNAVNPISVLWSNGAITEDINGLDAGTYDLTVTDANSCVQTESFNVSNTSSIGLTANLTPVSCIGGNDGAIDLSISGGTAPYTVSWSNAANTEDINALIAGSYTATVTDAAGCIKIQSFNITPGAQLQINLLSSSDEQCGTDNGAIQVEVNGGNGSYAYNWSNGANTETISGLSAGSYSLSVTDGNGCSATQSFSIVNDNSNCSSFCFLDASLNTLINETCGQANGALNIDVLNAVNPTTISWNNGAVTEDISGLKAGNYTVLITDGNACTVNKTFTVSNQTGTLAVNNVQLTDELCGNAAGAIDINPTGGTAPYTYSWSNASASEDLSGLTAGSYSLMLTDANGCSFTATYNILNQSGSLSVSGIANQSFCNSPSGSIVQTVSGSNGNVNYQWSNGASSQNLNFLLAGTYTCLITDQMGCSVQKSYQVTEGSGNIQLLSVNAISEVCGNAQGSINLSATGSNLTYLWNNGASSEDLTGLNAGTYSCVISNDQGCELSTGPIQVANSTGGLTVITQAITDELCGASDGAIDLSVSGGTMPYNFVWSHGATSEDLTGLTAGTYSLNVNDANGCIKAISLTVHPNSGTLALSAINVSAENCGNADGAIDLTTTGGIAPYTYAWSNGANTEDLTALTAGSYTLTLSDAAGCSLTEVIAVGPTNGTLSIQSASLTHDRCAKSTGAIQLEVSGGSLPYDFNWSNGASSEDISGLDAGVYNLILTDASGCVINTSYTLSNDPGNLSFSGIVTDENCGQANGAINTTITGGFAPLDINWSNGAITEDLTGLSAANYTLTVTDNLGCFVSQTYTLSNLTNGLAVSTASVTDESCGQVNGAIDILTTSAGLVSYLWSNGQTTEDLSGVPAGTYTLIATDQLGCSVSYTETVSNQTGSLAISFSSIQDALCGNPDGFVDIEVSGTGPFSYTWSNGANTQDITGLTSGTYDVNITDGLACSLVQSFVVNSSGLNMSLQAVLSDANCGLASGAIDLTVLNGTAPYTFVWSNGDNTEDLSALAAGSYTVQVSDFFSCETSGTFTVNTSGNGLVNLNQIFIQNEFCGFNDGSIFVDASNVFRFYLNGVQQFGSFFSNLAAGPYSIRMEDINGCFQDSTVQVGNDGNFSMSTATIDENCGQADGAVNLTVVDLFNQGLTFNFNWSNGAFTEDITGLSAGTYSVIVTDDFGCSLSTSALINNQSGTFDIASSQITPATCGTATGAIDLSVTGGTTPYTFVWSNGATSEDISALLPGTYSVSISDANNCTINETFVLNTSFSLSGIVTPSTCAGNDGAIDLQLIGGTAPFTVLWSNGAATQDLTNLTSGTYSVSVSDNTGCVETASFTITEQNNVNILSINTNPDFCSSSGGSIFVNAIGVNNFYINGVQDFNFGFFSNLAAGSYTIGLEDFSGCILDTLITIDAAGNFELTSVLTDESCGQSNGAIDVTANDIFNLGLVFTYNWNTGANSEDLNALSAGTYFVDVSDNFGCTIRETAVVSNQTGTLNMANAVITPADCGNPTGAIDITASGGTAPYTYNWSDGSTSEDRSNIGPGSYSVTVTDAANCSFTETYVIQNSFVLSSLLSNPGCSTADGSIDLTLSGGLAPYSILWSNGATTEDLSNLAAGTYSVSATDNSGCVLNASFTLTGQANITLFNIGANPDFCSSNQGSIFVQEIGTDRYFINGVEDFNAGFFGNLSAGTYTITLMDLSGCTLDTNVNVDNQGNFTLTSVLTDETCGQANGAIDLTPNDLFGQGLTFTYTWSNGSSNQDLSNLTAGTYTVNVMDNFGCLISQSNVVNNQTGGFELSNAAITQSNCGTASGAIDLSVTGGTPPYTFNWSNGATTEDLSGLSPGTYTVTISDINCSFTESFSIVNSFQVSATTTDALCPNNNGSIDLNVTSGQAPYNFLWSNGATSEDLTGLSAGTYSVTVTDNLGCTTNASFEVNQDVSITLFNIGTNPEFCNFNDGMIFVNAIGVQNFYIDGALDPNFGFFQNLASGNYLITLEDASGCTIDTNIVVGNQGNFTLSSVVNDENCGQGNGSINLTPNDVFGQGLVFTFDWSNGATTEDLFGLAAGGYQVDVSDNFGCTLSFNYTVSNQTGGLGITASTILQSNCGNPDGSIDLSVAGGTAPYAYSWSNGATTQDINGLAPGTYTVTVSDAVNCALTQSFVISNSFFINGVESAATCGSNNGSVNVSMSSGTAPYTFSWSNGATTEDLINVAAGIYTLTVTDATGCSTSETFTVSEQLSFTLNNIFIQPDFCNAGFGSIDVFNSGNVSDYLIDGQSNFGSNSFQGLTSGTYTISLIDASGCQLDTLVTVPFEVTFTPSFQVTDASCGAINGAIDLEVTDDFGLGAPFSYLWSTGAGTQDINGLSAGTYSVTIIHDLTQIIGTTCENSYDVVVNTAASFTMSGTVSHENCTAQDGAVNVTINSTDPISLNWSHGATTEDLSGLSAGTYTLTATDQSGCSLVNSFVVNRVSTLNFIGANISDENCGLADGAISLNLTGANPINYSWSNGASTQDISGLNAANYTVVITDANGCLHNETFTVNENSGISITALSIVSDTCLSGVGALQITSTGGAVAFYVDGVLNAGGSTFSQLDAGTYTFSLETATGCILDSMITIPNHSTFTALGSVTDENCGLGNGAINLSLTGGVAPFGFIWSNGAVSQDISGLSAGNYLLTITDAANCEQQLSFTVNNNTGTLALGNPVINQAYCSEANGSIDITVSGGTTPYTFNWSNGANTEDLTGLAAGTYNIIVTDATGCTLITDYNVTAAAPIAFSSILIQDDNCNQGNGVVFVQTVGAVITYAIDGVSNIGPSFNNLFTGSYTITISDGLGCSLDSLVTVGSMANFNASAVLKPEGCGQDNGSIDLSTDGQGMTYLWTNGATTEDLSGLTAGTYGVTMTDLSGCTLTRYFIIDSLSGAFDTAFAVSASASCSACADGSVGVTIANSGSYTYLWSNGAITKDINGLLPGIYSLKLTNIFGCDTIIQVEVLAETSETLVFNVAPNPAGGNFEVTVQFPGDEKGKLIMYDMIGQIVYESAEMNSGKIQFTAEHYSAATYFFAVRSVSIFERLKFEIIK